MPANAGYRRQLASTPRLDALEGADLSRPLRTEVLVRAGLQPHGLAGEVLVGEEVPGAALHLDRGDLVLPARLAELRLLLAGGHPGPGEVALGEDRDLAAALRGRRRRREGDRLRRRDRVRALAVLHALPVGAAIFEVDLLPVELAAVRREAGTVGPREPDIGVRIVVGAADQHDAERREGHEHLPLSAPPDLVLLLPDRRELVVGELDHREADRLDHRRIDLARTKLERRTHMQGG